MTPDNNESPFDTSGFAGSEESTDVEYEVLDDEIPEDEALDVPSTSGDMETTRASGGSGSPSPSSGSGGKDDDDGDGSTRRNLLIGGGALLGLGGVTALLSRDGGSGGSGGGNHSGTPTPTGTGTPTETSTEDRGIQTISDVYGEGSCDVAFMDYDSNNDQINLVAMDNVDGEARIFVGGSYPENENWEDMYDQLSGSREQFTAYDIDEDVGAALEENGYDTEGFVPVTRDELSSGDIDAYEDVADESGWREIYDDNEGVSCTLPTPEESS